MESKKETSYTYDVVKSVGRMDDILNASNSNFMESESHKIPSRDKLTFTNGFYVDVTALFIDIISSSDMTDEHKRPTLAKMYRAFLSECVAIMNSYSLCKEISINGDCVWGIFETSTINEVDRVTDVAAQLNSLIRILNYKLKKKEYSEIKVGIGIDDGTALMVKAGYSGSSINDLIWMGDVVNSACHICGKAGRSGRKTIIVSGKVYENILEGSKKLFTSFWMDGKLFYEGSFTNKNMDKWYDENCN